MTLHTPQPFIPAQPSSRAAALPAIIEALPGDDTRPPQMQFTRARQSDFLQRLADHGEVRVAARGSNVSHQCVYRLRRACPAFRRGWDAALLIARERAEEELATRAMNGVEEEVWYHGEVVATRRRYDSRLLLAHLARLDRMAEREDVAALAECFDAVIAAFEGCDGAAAEADAGQAGEEVLEETLDLAEVVLPDVRVPSKEGTSDAGDETVEAPACAGTHEGDADLEKTTSGPCHMRSMSPSDEPDGAPEEGALERRLQAMEAARPEGVGDPALGGKSVAEAGAIEAEQLAAFEAGDAQWWLIGLEEAGEADEGEADAGDGLG